MIELFLISPSVIITLHFLCPWNFMSLRTFSSLDALTLKIIISFNPSVTFKMLVILTICTLSLYLLSSIFPCSLHPCIMPMLPFLCALFLTMLYFTPTLLPLIPSSFLATHLSLKWQHSQHILNDAHCKFCPGGLLQVCKEYKRCK